MSKSVACRLFGALIAVGISAAPALAEGDAAKGEAIFKKCVACHTVDEGKPSRMGPNLYGLIGRTVGSAEGFKYSKAYTEANAAGTVWTDEHFIEFITNPKAIYSPTRMVLAVKDEQDRKDLLAFLKSHGPADAAKPAE